MKLEAERERKKVRRPEPQPPVTEQEEIAWENQTDPRLPRCLMEAEDRLEHLRRCPRCRESLC